MSEKIITEVRLDLGIKERASDPASSIVHTMLENNIGSVIFVEDDRSVGIITEKDLLDKVVKVKKKNLKVPT